MWSHSDVTISLLWTKKEFLLILRNFHQLTWSFFRIAATWYVSKNTLILGVTSITLIPTTILMIFLETRQEDWLKFLQIIKSYTIFGALSPSVLQIRKWSNAPISRSSDKKGARSRFRCWKLEHDLRSFRGRNLAKYRKNLRCYRVSYKILCWIKHPTTMNKY